MKICASLLFLAMSCTCCGQQTSPTLSKEKSAEVVVVVQISGFSAKGCQLWHADDKRKFDLIEGVITDPEEYRKIPIALALPIAEENTQFAKQEGCFVKLLIKQDGLMEHLRCGMFIFVTAPLQTQKEPNQLVQPTPGSITPPAAAGDRASGARGSF